MPLINAQDDYALTVVFFNWFDDDDFVAQSFYLRMFVVSNF